MNAEIYAPWAEKGWRMCCDKAKEQLVGQLSGEARGGSLLTVEGGARVRFPNAE